jgi:hypothetical protein
VLSAAQLQVLDPVVIAPPVLVMHRFVGLQRSAEVAGHDEAVLKDIASIHAHNSQRILRIDPDQEVAIVVAVSTALPVHVAPTFRASVAESLEARLPTITTLDVLTTQSVINRFAPNPKTGSNVTDQLAIDISSGHILFLLIGQPS